MVARMPSTTWAYLSSFTKSSESSGHRGLEPEQLAQGAADHCGPLVGGDARELAVDQFRAVAERPFGVRVVGAPHDGRQTADAPGGDGNRIILERDVELALHVLARLQRVRPLLVQAEQPRHLRLVVLRAGVVPVTE